MEQRHVVITGQIGTGMTTLFNKICNERQVCKAGGASVTQQAYSKRSAYGKGFIVYDTPGFGESHNNLNRAYILRKVLKTNLISRILVLVRNDRIDSMQRQLDKIIGIFNRYQAIITIVVTFMDQEREQNFQETFKNRVKTKFNINQFIFVSKETSGQQICNDIDKQIEKIIPQSVGITVSEFYTYLDNQDIYDDNTIELDMAIQEFSSNFRKKIQTIQRFFKQMDNDDSKLPQIIDSMISQVKQEINKEFQEFEAKNYDLFMAIENESNARSPYLHYYKLKKEIIGDLKDLIATFSKKILESPCLCLKYIKACPHCGLIWIKVTTCNEKVTVCGYFPEKDDEFIQLQLEASLSNDKNKETVKKLQQRIYQDPGIDKRFGCRKQFNWDEIPPLPVSLQIELFNLDVLRFLAFEQEQVNQQQLNAIEKAIDEEIRKIKINYL